MCNLDKISCNRLVQAESIMLAPDVELSYDTFLQDTYDKVYFEVRELVVANFTTEFIDIALAHLAKDGPVTLSVADTVKAWVRQRMQDKANEVICRRVNIITTVGSLTVGAHYDLVPNRKEDIIKEIIENL